ncbi:MAG: lysophospholipid acyltransferase family protein [Candidatus Brocadiaceae bacterium]|nr:lysophospholipid acyltransferase family protein [Candidatus Brocadiaceae bacterium]
MVLGKIKFFLVGLISSIFVRLLFCTLSVREIPDALSQKYKRQGKCMIYAFWHAHILVPTCVGRNLGAKVLVSQHRDGEYVAQTVRCLGNDVVRGSTTRGGARALLSMIKKVKEEKVSLAITPDGPRGPRFVVQAGVITLGQKTRYPIIPVMVHHSKCWELPSWDRFCVPKPFSKVVLIYGDPIMIPPKLEKFEVEVYRVLLEEAFVKLGNEAGNKA